MPIDPDLVPSAIAVSRDLGISPNDLLTAISYETGGTLDPWKKGPTTQWGQHRGLIQWGEPQAKQYGVTEGMPVADQMKAVGAYLRDRGVKPGMGMLDLYSTINAGRPGLYNRSDANNGGAPGTVADKVATQMYGHRQRANALLGGGDMPSVPTAASAPDEGGAVPLSLAPSSAEVDDPLLAALVKATQGQEPGMRQIQPFKIHYATPVNQRVARAAARGRA